MKVETSGMMQGITMRCDIGDFSKNDQIELFIMMFRHLNFSTVITPGCAREIGAHLITLQKTTHN